MEHIKTNQIKTIIKSFKDKEKDLKKTVDHYLTDKSVSVDERLEVFFEADLGKHEIWITHFSTLQNYCTRPNHKYSRNSVEDYLFDGDSYRRHQTVDIDHLLERVEEALCALEDWNTNQILLKASNPEYEILEFTPAWGMNLELFTDSEGKSFDRSSLAEFKEEILKMSIKSFDMDW